MISDDTIKSLHNCFKNNKIEIAIKSVAKNKMFKGAQKIKKWCFPLLLVSCATFFCTFSFSLFAPITFWMSTPFTLSIVSIVFLSLLGMGVFDILPQVVKFIEKIANQNDKDVVQQKEQTVVLLQELQTYSLLLKSKNVLNMVVAQLSDPTVSSSTWSKVNQCLHKMKQECDQLVVKVEKDNTLQASIKDLEKKFKPIDYNVMQL